MGSALRSDEMQTVTLVIQGPTPKEGWVKFTREMQALLHKHSRLNVRVKSIINEPKPKTGTRRRRRVQRKAKRPTRRRR